ncbi:MAG: hypothetical protein WCH60_17265 [Burkholderiales bacterium]
MASVKRHGRRRVSVSASELAQMGVCERLVVFEHRYGKRLSLVQHQAIKRGLRAHTRFFGEGSRALTRTGRRFVAIIEFVRWFVLCMARRLQARKPRHEA